MTELNLDRDLQAIFAAGPQTAPEPIIDRALAAARATGQRRPRIARLNTRAWPPQARSVADPTLRRSIRAVFVAVLVVLAAAAVVIVGSHLLPPPTRTELIPAGVLSRQIFVPAAIVLPDGRLLIHGQGGAAIFDPATGVSSDVDLGPFERPQIQRLGDGRMILIGPETDTGGPIRIGILDPVRQTTTGIEELPTHYGAAKVVLDDGRVLFAGGMDDESGQFVAFDSVGVFDPASGGISELGPMLKPRVLPEIVALDHGRVLIVGVDPFGTSHSTVDVELYDVARGSSEAVGTFTRSEFFLPGPSVRLSDGRVLIAGSQIIDRQCGETGDSNGGPYFEMHQEMHVFDPATGRLTQLADIPHSSAYLVPTADGRVVLFGTYLAGPPGACVKAPIPTVQPWVGIYDPSTGQTLETTNAKTGAATLPFAVVHHYGAGVLLPGGRIALISDDEGSAKNAVDLLSVAP